MRLPHLLLLMVMGTVIAGHHLIDGIWYDEAYTLEFFASSPRKALTDFHLPNNHPLFSLCLSLWQFAFGSHVVMLRLLPFFCWLATIALSSRAASSLGGVRCGVLSGLILMASHPLVNYSCQLRGYIMAAALYAAAIDAAIDHRLSPSRWKLTLFGLYQVLGAAVLPTQAIFSVPLAFLAIDRPMKRLGTFIMCSAVPLAGLGVYALHFEQFLSVVRTYDVGISHTTLLSEVFTSYLPLAGLGGLGILTLLAMAWLRLREDRFPWWFWPLLAAIVLPLGLALLMPRTPYPRNFLPLMPILVVAIALPLSRWLHGWLTTVAMVLVTGVCAMNEVGGGGYFERHKIGDKPETLVDLYHHHQFRPYEVASLALQESRNHCIILIDDSDLWALNHAFRFQLVIPSHSTVVYFPKLEQYPHLMKHVHTANQLLAISRNEVGVQVIAKACAGFGELPPRPMLLHDTGYFKLWELVRS